MRAVYIATDSTSRRRWGLQANVRPRLQRGLQAIVVRPRLQRGRRLSGLRVDFRLPPRHERPIANVSHEACLHSRLLGRIVPSWWDHDPPRLLPLSLFDANFKNDVLVTVACAEHLNLSQEVHITEIGVLPHLIEFKRARG